MIKNTNWKTDISNVFMYFLETMHCFTNIKVVLYCHKENKNKTLIYNHLYQILKK